MFCLKESDGANNECIEQSLTWSCCIPPCRSQKSFKIWLDGETTEHFHSFIKRTNFFWAWDPLKNYFSHSKHWLHSLRAIIAMQQLEEDTDQSSLDKSTSPLFLCTSRLRSADAQFSAFLSFFSPNVTAVMGDSNDGWWWIDTNLWGTFSKSSQINEILTKE